MKNVIDIMCYRAVALLIIPIIYLNMALAQVSSQQAVVLPQGGSSALVVESGQTLTVTSGISITLKPGVHFKSGSNLRLNIAANMSGPVAPNNPNDNLDMNWTLARSFDADGTIIGETKIFFDYNGRILQTQVKNLDAGHVLATENLYDIGGQLTGSTMPAPINNAGFSYKANFARKADGSNLNYRSYSRFINGTTSYDKTRSPDPTDASQIGTLGYYYSTNNPWERLQDVTEYPYSVTAGPKNGTNVFAMEGGVGANLRLGGGHEILQYQVPVTKELDFYTQIRNHYFDASITGNKAFISSSNKVMSVSVDEDSRASVSMSVDGRTVLTGRDGNDLVLDGTLVLDDNETGYFGIVTNQVVTFSAGMLKDYFRSEAEFGVAGARTLQPGLYQYSNYRGNSVNYKIGLSDVTFTFYDQLGRVRATIPPEGVKRLVSNGLSAYSSLSEIPFVHIFEYDGRDNLIASVDPDAGRSEFKYSSDGKLRYSQNALQRQQNKFSYSNYDQYGRVVESGELQPSGTLTFSSITQAMLDAVGVANTAYPTGTKFDVTTIKYDEADPIAGLTGYIQDTYFLSGSAVSSKARYRGAVSEANLISKTWYNYDGDGNIAWTVKYTPDLGYKTMDYTYDSMGKIVKTIFQKNTSAETFVHYYQYDKNNRLAATYTNTTDNVSNRILQAKYSYYLHGPLKRVELGDKLQGIDYVYSIDGKLKSINNAQAARDPGQDGSGNGFSPDVFGMNLEYYQGDYRNAATGIGSIQTNSSEASYSGQVNGISWFSRKPSSVTGLDGPVMNIFRYDASGQLLENRWGTPNFNGNAFVSANEIYRERGLTYDSNGNIRSMQRTNASGVLSHNLTYTYQPNTNKLSSVSGYATFTYDAIGQLVSQMKGSNGMYLDYDVFGQVTKIYSDGAKSQIMLSFVYDDDGNRIMKKDHRNNTVTWYSYDAGGTLVAIFDNNGANRSVRLLEQPVYGANRLGTYYRSGSNYQYTVTDHLGNTRVVINRNKLSNGNADVVYYADYYPFGSTLRSAGIENRFGYQGLYAEKDNETGWNSFELRNYDPAIGRWLSTDPYGQYWSPYVGMGNNPVMRFDPDGGWDGGGGGLWGWLRGLVYPKGHEKNPIAIDEVVVTANLVGPKREPVSGFWGHIDYHLLGGNVQDGFAYDKQGNSLGFAPMTGMPPDFSLSKPVKILELSWKALKAAKEGKPILNAVNTGQRTGSAAYKSLNVDDAQHFFSNIVDNYASQATKFSLKGGDGVTRNLYQIHGSLRGQSGVFEWIVDGANVTHRRFIPGGAVNGIPNQIVR